MVIVFFLFLAIVYFFIFVGELVYINKHGFQIYFSVLLLVLVGLLYDNLMIASGKWIGEGGTLEFLSKIRYILHVIFTPTLLLFALGVSLHLNLIAMKKMLWKGLAWLVTFGLILYELFTSVFGMKLEPKWKYGLLTYESTADSNFPLMIMVIHLVFIVIGFWLVKKYRFPWLFLRTIFMILGGVLTIWIKFEPMMNFCELLFMLSLVMTRRFNPW